MPILVSPLHDPPIAANAASVSLQHWSILIVCKWTHPWVRFIMSASVMYLLYPTLILVSPLHDSPIASNAPSVSREYSAALIVCKWMHRRMRNAMPSSVMLLLTLMSMLVSSRHDCPIAANAASVNSEHLSNFIVCKRIHPWVRQVIPPSVMLLLQLMSMLVSPLHDSPIAVNAASVSS